MLIKDTSFIDLPVFVKGRFWMSMRLEEICFL